MRWVQYFVCLKNNPGQDKNSEHSRGGDGAPCVDGEGSTLCRMEGLRLGASDDSSSLRRELRKSLHKSYLKF